jgi:16S rRNA (cytosine1402-N4)-methyltransferase
MGGKVLGLDQDPDSLNACPDLDGLTKVLSNFTHLSETASSNGFTPANGILFDLGVSLHQLITPDRGFSFQSDGPLDMRMNQNEGVSASVLISALSVKQLTKLLKDYGEEPSASSIAKKIIDCKPKKTIELASLLKDNNQRRRVFQALRIAVNDELGSLEVALPQALSTLASHGRICILAFQSLEDRIVKKQFLEWERQGLGLVITNNPETPSLEEITLNPQSKSAKLRVFEKI